MHHDPIGPMILEKRDLIDAGPAADIDESVSLLEDEKDERGGVWLGWDICWRVISTGKGIRCGCVLTNY